MLFCDNRKRPTTASEAHSPANPNKISVDALQIHAMPPED